MIFSKHKNWFFLVLSWFLSLGYGMTQNCDIINASKMIVLTEYHEFLVNDCNNTSMITVDTLDSTGTKDILFLHLKCRKLSYLKFYFQTNILNKQNGNWFSYSSTEYEKYFEEAFGTLDSINNVLFYEEKIGSDKFLKNEILYQGDFILAYLDGRFLRLKGFRYNDFAEFVFRYLTPGSRFVSPILAYQLDQVSRERERKRVLLDLIQISGLDLPELYNRHIKRREFRERDSYYINTINWLK